MLLIITLILLYYYGIYIRTKKILKEPMKQKTNNYKRIKYIIIYKEGDNIKDCYESLINQGIKPKKIIIIGRNLKIKFNNSTEFIDRKFIITSKFIKKIIEINYEKNDIFGVFRANTLFKKNSNEKILNFYNNNKCGTLYVFSDIMTSKKFLKKYNFYKQLNEYSMESICDFFTTLENKDENILKNFLITKIDNENLFEYFINGFYNHNFFLIAKYYFYYFYPSLFFIEYLIQLVFQCIIIFENLCYNQALESDFFYLYIGNLFFYIQQNLPKIELKTKSYNIPKLCNNYKNPKLSLISKTKNGILYQVDDSNLEVIHLYGNSYQKGYAYGNLCKTDFLNIVKLLDSVFKKLEPTNGAMKIIYKESSTMKECLFEIYNNIKKFISKDIEYFMKGISDSTNICFNEIVAITLIPELYHQHCLLFSRMNNNDKLFIRTLDHFFYQDKHILRVYHNENSNSYCELGTPGTIWNITSVSEKLICLGETSGKINASDNLNGYPFYLFFKDILKNYDKIDDIKSYLKNITRNNNIIIMVSSLLENKTILVESTKKIKFYDSKNFGEFLNKYSQEKINNFNSDIIYDFNTIDKINKSILNLDDFTIDNINSSILKLYKTGGNHSMIVDDKYQLYIKVNSKNKSDDELNLYLFDLLELFNQSL